MCSDQLFSFQTKFVALEKSISETDKVEKKSKSVKQQVIVCVVSGIISFIPAVRNCVINEMSLISCTFKYKYECSCLMGNFIT